MIGTRHCITILNIKHILSIVFHDMLYWANKICLNIMWVWFLMVRCSHRHSLVFTISVKDILFKHCSLAFWFLKIANITSVTFYNIGNFQLDNQQFEENINFYTFTCELYGFSSSVRCWLCVINITHVANCKKSVSRVQWPGW